MYCTRCGVELREDDRFCSRCGSRTAAGAPIGIQPEMPLLLDKRNKKVAGVCAGFARYLGVDVLLVRVIWLGVALCTGVGFVVYLAVWMVIPSDGGLEPRRMIAGAPQAT